MNDTKLYEQILGLHAPWSVKSVMLKAAEGTIEIEVACAETLWGCHFPATATQWRCHPP